MALAASAVAEGAGSSSGRMKKAPLCCAAGLRRSGQRATADRGLRAADQIKDLLLKFRDIDA